MHSGLSLPVFTTVKSGEENLIFLLAVPWLRVLGPSYTLPLPLIPSLTEQLRKVKSLQNSCRELHSEPAGHTEKDRHTLHFGMYRNKTDWFISICQRLSFLFSFFLSFILLFYFILFCKYTLGYHCPEVAIHRQGFSTQSVANQSTITSLSQSSTFFVSLTSSDFL